MQVDTIQVSFKPMQSRHIPGCLFLLLTLNLGLLIYGAHTLPLNFHLQSLKLDVHILFPQILCIAEITLHANNVPYRNDLSTTDLVLLGEKHPHFYRLIRFV